MTVEEEAKKALRCLYIAVEADIAKDVENKVMAAFVVKDARIAELEHAIEQPRKPASPGLEEAREMHKLIFDATMKAIKDNTDVTEKIKTMKCICGYPAIETYVTVKHCSHEEPRKEPNGR